MWPAHRIFDLRVSSEMLPGSVLFLQIAYSDRQPLSLPTGMQLQLADRCMRELNEHSYPQKYTDATVEPQIP